MFQLDVLPEYFNAYIEKLHVKPPRAFGSLSSLKLGFLSYSTTREANIELAQRARPRWQEMPPSPCATRLVALGGYRLNAGRYDKMRKNKRELRRCRRPYE